MIIKITIDKLSVRNNNHIITVTPINYDPKTQRLLVSLNNKVAETILNEKTGNLIAKIEAPIVNSNNLNTIIVPDVRVKVFVYDFVKDKILGAKLQEFKFNLQQFEYIPIDNLLTTTKVIMGVWDKKSIVEKAKKEVVILIKNFKIDFSLNKSYKTFVPLAIPDFNNNPENYSFVFNYSLSLSNIDELNFTIKDENDSIVFTKFYLKPVKIKSVIKNKNLKKKVKDKSPIPIISSNDLDIDYTNIGNYQLYWEGFNNENVFDSSLFNNKKFKATITAYKNGKFKKAEVEFQTKYKEVDWVDVKINRKTKQIDTTLRVNLNDGGAFGLDCKQEQIVTSTLDVENDHGLPKFKTVCPWDKIPADILKPENPIIKERTQSFKELEKLALKGINYHWGRNKNHVVAKNVDINGEIFQMYMNAVNSTEDSMDNVDLMFNTNYFWGRSNNPGCVSGFKSFLANLAQYIPYIPLNETLFYNVGYVNNVYEAQAQFLWKKRWFYIDPNLKYKNGKNKVDMDYGYTCAHEIGHTILRSYAENGGGSADYSYEHKGSSGYSDVKPLNEGGVNYPKKGEIDLMKYFNNDPNFLEYDFDRIAADNKDSLGIIWLTKITIL